MPLIIITLLQTISLFRAIQIAKMQNTLIVPMIILLLEVKVRRNIMFTLTRNYLILFKGKGYAQY